MTFKSPTPIKFVRNLLVAASAATLAACATATPYQPASEPGGFDGFSQQLIENDRARITFGGNSLTKRDTVENYLLYRAAEMAVERGFDSFTLQERETEKTSRVRVSPGAGGAFGGAGFYDPYFGYSFYRPRFGWSRGYRFSRFAGFNRRAGFGRRGFYDPFYDPFFDDFDVREITKYRATAEVKFGRGTIADGPNTFDAREVLENLGAAIEFSEDRS